jgi:DNA (cytosine-5)-methyltransferase 1
MKIETGSALRATREAIGLSQAQLAELTGISQHILSAFELGKADVDRKMLTEMSQVLSDPSKVNDLLKRKKRYQDHTYGSVIHDPDRRSRHTRSRGNDAYSSLINGLDLGKRADQHSALSLFSGCGGMSLGFSWAGCKIKGHLELDKGLREIYRANFPSSIELGGDISSISDSYIEGTRKDVGDIDIIIGGPPCQGFSLSGKRQILDPRNTLFLDYLRFVDVYKPKMAVLENVRLLTSMKSPQGGYVRDEIQREFQNRGYKVSMYEANAKDYGVPQHRERVFFVAVRNDVGVLPSFPEPTHGDRLTDLFSEKPVYRNFADACSDLEFLESGEKSSDLLHKAVSHPQHVINWLWDVQEGYSAHDNEDPNMRPPSGYNTTYKRQVWHEPGATVQTTFGMISGCRNVHPISTRSLTIREAARLQSFPDEFKFIGTQGTIRTGIGNAVPPLLAYQIGNHLLSQLV